MKLLLLLLFCYLFVTTYASFKTINENLNDEWELYKTKFDKKYNSINQELSKRLIWEENLKIIQNHNLKYDLGKSSYQMGLNEFSDLTKEEYIFQIGGLNNIKRSETKYEAQYQGQSSNNLKDLPSHVDWRTKGYVTPVKNQGQKCHSDWAFSTVGAVEGQYFKATGKLVDLSVQQLMDCNNKSHGCCRGSTYDSFLYIKQYGIESDKSYIYKRRNHDCHYNKKEIVTNIKNFFFLNQNEHDLRIAVAKIGPISSTINPKYLQHYHSGILDEPDCKGGKYDVYYGTLVVGYGEQNNKRYWIVKNSQGTDWGMNGYVLMARDKGNQCGIATLSFVPVI